MIIKHIISGYKTHDNMGLVEHRVTLKYCLSFITQIWNWKIHNVELDSILTEGESLEYCIYDVDFINQKIDKEYGDIDIYDMREKDHIFVNEIIEQEKYERNKDREKRRWLNHMEIEHD